MSSQTGAYVSQVREWAAAKTAKDRVDLYRESGKGSSKSHFVTHVSAKLNGMTTCHPPKFKPLVEGQVPGKPWFVSTNPALGVRHRHRTNNGDVRAILINLYLKCHLESCYEDGCCPGTADLGKNCQSVRFSRWPDPAEKYRVCKTAFDQ